MKRGEIRRITWSQPIMRAGEPVKVTETEFASPAETRLATAPPSVVAVGSPELTPVPQDAVEEAVILLRIAAEVESALMVQYLYAAYSVLPNLIVDLPGIDHPVLSDDWYDVVREIARQEMGHLITVQNLLLSLDAVPHLDRENFSCGHWDLYPFPFHLHVLALDTLAEYVVAEAPRDIAAADKADYQEAVTHAKGVVGHVSRVGQIYERLYWLFQDDDASQEPWTNVTNPFPKWPRWHIGPDYVGFNQDRQALPGEWRGSDASDPPDTAVYVLTVTDKATARGAIFRLAQQGEGPANADQVDTHFEKFLRLYKEFRAYSQQAGAPAFVRNQAANPTTQTGSQTGTITDLATLEWARFANVRYQMLLLDIALSLSVGQTGFVPGTTAGRRDFLGWSFREMRPNIKKLGEQLRTMPLEANGPAESVRAGLPFELPAEHSLPMTTPEQVAMLRTLVHQSQTIRKTILEKFPPTPGQQSLLNELEKTDQSVAQKIAVAESVPDAE